MTLRETRSWVLSLGLHCIMAALFVLSFKNKPIETNEPAISVDIIADMASGIGPDDTLDVAQSAKSEAKEANDNPSKIENEIPTDAAPPPPIAINEPVPEIAPLPQTKQLPIIKPAPIEESKPIAKPLIPFTKPQNSIPQPKPQAQKPPVAEQKKLSPPIKPVVKPNPQAQAQKPQNQLKPQTQVPAKQQIAKPAIKKNNNDFAYQFDLSAATKASAGAKTNNTGPKLTFGGASASGLNKGGGAKLQGNLEGVLRDQVKQCWAEPADLSDPNSLKVELQMELTLDGNLAKAPKLIYPASKSGASASVLVAIDNAMRAAKQCAPYQLPRERYAEWQKFTFRFDPKKLKH